MTHQANIKEEVPTKKDCVVTLCRYIWAKKLTLNTWARLQPTYTRMYALCLCEMKDQQVEEVQGVIKQVLLCYGLYSCRPSFSFSFE